MRDRGRSTHTFEPLKATLDFDVFRLALEARRLAEADARLQQARQDAASRIARSPDSPTSKVPLGRNDAETLIPGSKDALISSPAFSEAGPTADAQPEEGKGELQPHPDLSPLDRQAINTAAHTPTGQPTDQTPVDDEQNDEIKQQRSMLQRLKNELLLRQAARSDQIQEMCKEVQQLQVSRVELHSQLDKVRSWQL